MDAPERQPPFPGIAASLLFVASYLLVASNLLVSSLLVAAEPCAAPRLFRIGSSVGPGRIHVDAVGAPGSRHQVPAAANPTIQGNNLYAPHLLRVGGLWYCYHGGWLDAGQTNDRIYLSRSGSPDGLWTPSEAVVLEGIYIHVNDPSVVIDEGSFTMAYTAARSVGGDYRDWINISTSPDGVVWTPREASLGTEIVLADLVNLAGGEVTDIARPSLVRLPGAWRMWFDARVGNGNSLRTFLAESTDAVPREFRIVRNYPDVDGWPALFEPDIRLRPDGTLVGVVQRRFSELHLVTSADGILFDHGAGPVLGADDPAFGRAFVSNPGLVHDPETALVLGLAFGMTDSTSLVAHDVGFSFAQYRIEVESPGSPGSPGPVVHAIAEAEGLGRQAVRVFEFDRFSKARVRDPDTGVTLLEQDFSTARPADLWSLSCDGTRPSPLLEIDLGTGLGPDGKALPDRVEDPRWTLARGDDPTWKGPRVWTVRSDAFPIPPWIASSAASRWITARPDDTTLAPGVYTYRLRFDLSGHDPERARIEGRFTADDAVSDVILNGRSLGLGQSGSGFFEAWHPFPKIATGFEAGENTLELVVENGGTDPNPSGFRLEARLMAPAFLPGDVNLDLRVDVSDAVGLLRHLFLSETVACARAGEFNGDGEVDIADAVAILIHLFAGGPAPEGTRVDCAR